MGKVHVRYTLIDCINGNITDELMILSGGFDMNVNNRRVEKTELTFFQWLNLYEFMTKKEFKELPKYKQENYKLEFEMFQKGLSQYN